MDEKGLAGFKKSEFSNATPERVFGTEDVTADDLPSGARLYMREKSMRFGDKKVIVNVYRLLDDGGLKIKRLWVGRMTANRTPEDEEIAERFGGGIYVWIMKWEGPDGKEVGIVSETIYIDEELGRAAHDAWARRQAPADSTPAVPPSAVPAAPPAGGIDFKGILDLMAAAEQKALSTFERIAMIVQGNKTEAPVEVMKSVYAGANEMMAKAFQANLQMSDSVRKVEQARIAREAAEAVGEDDGGEGAPAEADEIQVPGFLKPFVPLLEKGIERLLGGGPVAAVTKQLIVTDEEWSNIFNDPEKWGQLVSFVERRFGTEKAGRALDILLNRRGGKPAGAPAAAAVPSAKVKGKGKGK